MFKVSESLSNQMKNVQTMLAVILTKSFRCLFHSKVYISLFFCVLELCFWYSLRVVCCLQALCCQRGLSEGTKGDKETLDLCKIETEFLFMPVMWFKEQ